jgi:hypothetical protein
MNLLRLTVLTIAILSPMAHAQQFDVVDQNLGEFLSISRTVIDTGKGESSVYIQIGRSLSPVSAILTAAGYKAVNLPLSHFRFGEKIWPRWDRDFQQSFFGYFDLILPSVKELNGRSIVLIDIQQSGATLRSAHRAISEYYNRDKANPVQVSAVAVSKDSKAARSYDGKSAFVVHSIKAKKEFQKLLFDSKAFKQFSEYESYDSYSDKLLKDPKVPMKLPIFEQLVTHLKTSPAIVAFSAKGFEDICNRVMRGRSTEPIHQAVKPQKAQ